MEKKSITLRIPEQVYEAVREEEVSYDKVVDLLALLSAEHLKKLYLIAIGLLASRTDEVINDETVGVA